MVNGASPGSSSGGEMTGICLARLDDLDTCILYCLTSTTILSFSISNKTATNKV